MRVNESNDEIGKCGCGRSPTGKCVGWHGLSDEEFRVKLKEFQQEQREKLAPFRNSTENTK